MVSWCHGVLRSIQELLKRKPRTNRDTTPFELGIYNDIYVFLGFLYVFPTLKHQRHCSALVQIHPLPGTSRSGRGKGQIGRRAPGRGFSSHGDPQSSPWLSHGRMPWIIFRDKTGNLQFESCSYLMYL